MERKEAEEILDEVSGDEHSWIDFKTDYEIGGIKNKKVEFIKDVASLSNTITDHDLHYIFVGVDDDGAIVGITEGRESYRGEGPRHIFSYDESDIQEMIDSNLEPAPIVSWHKFDASDPVFACLTIEPLDTPPTLTTNTIQNSAGNVVLQEGLIYLRKGSGKKIAEKQDIERIVKYRINAQREQILDGIHKAIEIGPEWIERIGTNLSETGDIPLATVENPENADLQVTERITREPASTLDEQLNEDIAQWRGRGDDYINKQALYEYYSQPAELKLDDIAIKFLTHSALKNDLLGIFWLERAERTLQRDIITSIPNYYHRIERAAMVCLIMDDREGYDQLTSKSKYSGDHGDLRICNQKMGNTVDDLRRYLLDDDHKGQYTLKHRDYKKEISVKDMSDTEIRKTIPDLSAELVDLHSHYQENRLFNRYHEFRDALWDLEAELGLRTMNKDKSD
ncbi:ATP-binding protein [Halorubrum sp. CBA1229]|uniref:AlbA family DNA-binding domain-containing protein n=1 Tax=Halorubrum sp. CBA1229 TaxID=1853699 RepID=UPI000F3C7165|nr:ATP-binding protein [Halorubrum sp. CBA1229]QKY17732.1 ATP-binding protein [Halorubrum sp. CBA1229]